MRVAVIGAGIGGLCVAIALQKIGISAQIYEAAPEIKPLGAGIGLTANAIIGLKKLGVVHDIFDRGQQVMSLCMLDAKGKIISDQNTGLLGADFANANLVIHRAELHEVLMNALPSGVLHLGKRVLYFDQNEEDLTIHFEDGSRLTTDLLIAADGIRSAVRQQLIPESKPRYAGYTCWRATIENPTIDLNEMVSAETWTANGRVGVSPLPNNRIYWYCCMKAKQNDEDMKRMTPENLLNYFRNIHFPIEKVIQSTEPVQLIWNDIFDIKPLRHFVYGNIVLLGDAAHAMTPNMGQGACQAIEDAVVLASCIVSNKSLSFALKEYEQRRVKRTAEIIRQSRLLGQIAHWQNPFWCGFRNRLLRSVPDRITKRQIAKLLKVDF